MAEGLYSEMYRPQFHFSPRTGWTNDPNGLVFYKGEYHLFFQHNPFDTKWGNMTWGHAVSEDLVHWRQIENAILPDHLGTIFSGSAVVDWNNTAGFQTGEEKVLVAIYTAAGGTNPESKGQPFTQCIAYSNDRGRTWTKYAGNPVLKHIAGGNRDPKVIWHVPTGRWIMALYVDIPIPGKVDEKGKPAAIRTIQFFSSPNLKDWTLLSQIEGFHECPDLFELPVDGNPKKTRWVLFGTDGQYLIGQFDGKQFIKESGKHVGDFGKNFYAAQTYSDIPASDGRRILIAWMQGGQYPGMPFNQQMTFPAELTLRAFPEGIRMCRYPVKEIEKLRAAHRTWGNQPLPPGENPLSIGKGDLFDISAEIELGAADEVAFTLRGETVMYTAADRKLSCLGKSAELVPVNGRIKLRILLDRASIEIFGNDCRIPMSFCFLPKPDDQTLALSASGGSARLISLTVHELHSAWSEAAL
jgi:sucrose-6-phosphate hydrolase SacC (GH32 family)